MLGLGRTLYLNFSVSHNSSIIEENCNSVTGCNKMRYRLVRQNITSQLIWDLSFMIKKNDFDTERIKEKYGKIAEQYLHEILENWKRMDIVNKRIIGSGYLPKEKFYLTK